MDRIGRYKIVRELGRGAMGVVYHAIDPNIGRPVAIKTIHFGGNRKPEEIERMRERLFREARSAGMLSHPGIVTIYDVEQQGDLAYIAMEYVDGPTLDQVLSEPEPLEGNRLFSILGQTAVALDYAHSKGIVHRDIKPANIMISEDGTSKIADFGIAKIAAAENLTMTGSIVGTPHYMSPEQVQGQPVDGRSDQFSLAVIAYEMLTGEKPYTGEHLTTVVYKIVAEEPVLPHRLNPSLSTAIENVLRKALSKKPDARYRNCQEFIDALEKACSASKGWKSMPRGGLLNAMTMADAKAVPAAAAASAVLRAAASQEPGRRHHSHRCGRQAQVGISHVPVGHSDGGGIPGAARLAVVSVALPGSQPNDTGEQQTAATPKQEPPPSTAPPAAAPVTPPAPAPQDAKPSPVGQADQPRWSLRYRLPTRSRSQPSSPVPAPRPKQNVALAAPVEPAGPQEVMFMTSPGGATATLDGNPAMACSTPCSLNAAPGRHTLSIVLPGYQIERREFMVGTRPLELPPIVMQAVVGTLMLSSDPARRGDFDQWQTHRQGDARADHAQVWASTPSRSRRADGKLPRRSKSLTALLTRKLILGQ